MKGQIDKDINIEDKTFVNHKVHGDILILEELLMRVKGNDYCPKCKKWIKPKQKMGGKICPKCRIIL